MIPKPPPPSDDARFPSGPWTGFFLQKELPGRHTMELALEFRDGEIRGEGRDRVGKFLIKGKFEAASGRCWWTKSYIGRHDVSYQGYNEGRGIWGLWEIAPFWKGGFHIWPEGMADPTRPTISEAEDLPVAVEDWAESEVGADAEEVAVTVGR